MKWVEKHRLSEHLSSQAESAKRDGDKTKARSLYKAAAEAEAEALKLISSDKIRTLGITAVSSASLYFKADENDLAENLAMNCLIQPGLPAFAKEQLHTIVQTIWNERRFRESGVQFVPGELLVSISGGLVNVGAAPLDLVNRKVLELRNLFFRAIEMLLQLPLRLHGSPAQEISDQFRPWICQAAPGSYQFALRVEKPSQRELFSNATLEIEEVTGKLWRILEESSRGMIEELNSTIPNDDYRDCFVKLIRNLAPTGKTFELLTISSTSHAESSPAIFSPESRKVLAKSIESRRRKPLSDKSLSEHQIVGILRAVHLDQDWLEIVCEGTDDHVKIYQTGDVIDDLIGPMVNHKVIVDTYLQSDGKHLYKDIQSKE